MSLSMFSELMLPAIEEELKKNVDSVKQARLDELHNMLAYHLGWEGEGAGPKARGKRIRPLLLLLTTASKAEDWHRALPCAAAVELVHNFSLIHDDIQDKSPLRRGRPTIWKRWGIPQAINAGDSLFALAHTALQYLNDSIPYAVKLRAHQIIPQACLTLTQGQYLDLAYEQKGELSTSDYWPMIRGKTASLLATCTELGALIGGAGEKEINIYRTFGECIGLAFQIYDDILGIWGDSALTGKSTESDLLTGKKSLPVLYALEKRGGFAKHWKGKGVKPEEVMELAEELKSEGAYEYAKRETDKLTNQALEWLGKMKMNNPASDALIELSNQLTNREH
jgi:geranylgeranyl diphosphate synthase type I